jgi:hypothetical protein
MGDPKIERKIQRIPHPRGKGGSDFNPANVSDVHLLGKRSYKFSFFEVQLQGHFEMRNNTRNEGTWSARAHSGRIVNSCQEPTPPNSVGISKIMVRRGASHSPYGNKGLRGDAQMLHAFRHAPGSFKGSQGSLVTWVLEANFLEPGSILIKLRLPTLKIELSCGPHLSDDRLKFTNHG